MPCNKHKFRLPKSIRLKKRSEIRTVMDRGERASGKNITLFRVKSPEKKFAVLIHRRVGNAVQRNRMKRLAREFYRLHPERFEKTETIIYIRNYQPDMQAFSQEIFALLKKQ